MSETSKHATGFDRGMVMTALITVLAIAIGILTVSFLPEWVIPVGIVLALVVGVTIVARRNRRQPLNGS